MCHTALQQVTLFPEKAKENKILEEILRLLWPPS